MEGKLAMKIIVLMLIAAPIFASGPKYVGSKTDPNVYQEFGNVYHDLSVPSSFVTPRSFTKAQIQATIPQTVGQIYYCSDCTTDVIVVSTGTGTGAFSRISSRTTAIQ